MAPGSHRPGAERTPTWTAAQGEPSPMTGTRRLVVPLLVVLALVGGIWGAILVQGIKPRLGLDLTGGTSVTFRPHSPDGRDPTEDQLNTTIDPRQLPASLAFNPATSTANPAFPGQTSDFWAQGLSFEVGFRY